MLEVEKNAVHPGAQSDNNSNDAVEVKEDPVGLRARRKYEKGAPEQQIVDNWQS